MMEQEIIARHVADFQFDITTETGQTVRLDTHDSGTGATPMEMVLASLAGCSGISVISILRKKQLDITQYEVRVSGTRAATHPQVFTEIVVEHTLTGRGIPSQAVERAIELAETRYCSVSVMLSKAVQLQHSYRIIEVR